MLKTHLMQTRRDPSKDRRARRLQAAVLALAISISALAFASPALAGLKKDFSVFYDCPVNTPGVGACIVSITNSGEFVIGAKTVAIDKTITLQGGISETSPQLVPAVDGNTLSKTPLTVPGGLTGIEGLGGEVTATSELAGPVTLELENLGTNNPAIRLPLKVNSTTLRSAARVSSARTPNRSRWH